MTKSIVISLLFLIINPTSIIAQGFDFKNREIKSDEDLLHSVSYIYLYKKNADSSIYSGSAYFFHSSISNKLYLITNNHLINQIDNIGAFIALKDKNGNADESYIGQFKITLKNRIKSIQNIDLCLIDLTDYSELLSKYYFKCYSEDNIPNIEEIENLSFKDDLYCIGFSYSLFDVLNGLPIVLRGSLASLPKYDFMQQKEFAINCSNRSGSSGSPIVLNKNSKYFLLGTVRATDCGEEMLYKKTAKKNPIIWENIRNIGDLQEIDSLKVNSKMEKIVVKDNFNISYVIKSSIINDILNKNK